MAIKYKKVNTNGKLSSITLTDTSDATVLKSIPIREKNRHYAEWKEWDAQEGNTTEAAD